MSHALLAFLCLTASQVQLPVVPSVTPPPAPAPAPAPPPASDKVSSLPADCFYVVQSDKPFLITGSPNGLIAVLKVKGPTGPMIGRFAEEPDKIQVKQFDKPHVAVITAKAAGAVELLVIPEGITEEKDIVRQHLTLGKMPQPPPDVKPPDVFPPLPSDSELRVLFFYDKDKYTPKQVNVMQAQVVRDYLDKNCPKGEDGKTPDRRWFINDADMSKESATIREMVDATRPKDAAAMAAWKSSLPQVVIFRGQAGKSYPLPSTVDELLRLLKGGS